MVYYLNIKIRLALIVIVRQKAKFNLDFGTTQKFQWNSSGYAGPALLRFGFG